MKELYDFSKARANPYARRLQKQVTIRLDEETIDYFRSLADGLAIPYQTLIRFYLRDCADRRLQLAIAWRPDPAPPASSQEA